VSGLVRIIESEHRDRVGEGPLWSAHERALYWVDILAPRLNRLDLETDVIQSWDMPELIGWVIEREKCDGFVAGLKSGFVFLEFDPLRITPIASPEPELPANRLNDAKADPRGCIWAGTMPMDGAAPDGALYRLHPDGQLTRVDHGYRIPNGPAFSPDGRWLYHADSALRVVYRYAIRDEGSLSGREDFIRFEGGWGLPDGMTVDADGHLWIAHWGGGAVSRFTPDGRRQRSIELPASQISSCTFAGENLERMFVTSAAEGVDEDYGGALFEVNAGCLGLRTCRFAG
jgi:sugar lactone lactonase YvrE